MKTNSDPTRVIMLTNLVGKGEVDDDLIEDVREECSRFGEITVIISYLFTVNYLLIILEFKSI